MIIRGKSIRLNFEWTSFIQEIHQESLSIIQLTQSQTKKAEGYFSNITYLIN